MDIPKELDERLMTLEAALDACFGGHRTTEDGYLQVDCCGEVTYGSGIMGPDIARCKKCGRAVVMVLSPHVSPLLLDGSVTHIPSDEFIEAIGDRCWIVAEPQP